MPEPESQTKQINERREECDDKPGTSPNLKRGKSMKTTAKRKNRFSIDESNAEF